MKKCIRCNEIKSLDLFVKNAQARDGHRNTCKPCHRHISRKYDCSEKKKKYYQDNKEYIKNKSKQNYHKNPKAHMDRSRRYKNENIEYIRKLERERHKERCAEDPSFKLLVRLRSRQNRSIAYGHKSKTTLALLGCTVEQCWIHLESQFTEGMTRENYGEWHIDHIRPLVSFNLSDLEQQKIAFHYSNLQPLWAIDNIKKGGKFFE